MKRILFLVILCALLQSCFKDTVDALANNKEITTDQESTIYGYVEGYINNINEQSPIKNASIQVSVPRETGCVFCIGVGGLTDKHYTTTDENGYYELTIPTSSRASNFVYLWIDDVVEIYCENEEIECSQQKTEKGIKKEQINFTGIIPTSSFLLEINNTTQISENDIINVKINDTFFGQMEEYTFSHTGTTSVKKHYQILKTSSLTIEWSVFKDNVWNEHSMEIDLDVNNSFTIEY